MKKNTRLSSYYLPVELLESFQRSYPRLLTTFIRRCMIRSLRDKDFFDDVFFGTVDEYESIGQNNPEYVIKGLK